MQYTQAATYILGGQTSLLYMMMVDCLRVHAYVYNQFVSGKWHMCREECNSAYPKHSGVFKVQLSYTLVTSFTTHPALPSVHAQQLPSVHAPCNYPPYIHICTRHLPTAHAQRLLQWHLTPPKSDAYHTPPQLQWCHGGLSCGSSLSGGSLTSALWLALREANFIPEWNWRAYGCSMGQLQ